MRYLQKSDVMRAVSESIDKRGTCTVMSISGFNDDGKQNMPTISPFTKARTVEGVRARHCNETSNSRVHSFETYRTSRQLVRIRLRRPNPRDRLRYVVVGVDLHRKDAYCMTYFGLERQILKTKTRKGHKTHLHRVKLLAIVGFSKFGGVCTVPELNDDH